MLHTKTLKWNRSFSRLLANEPIIAPRFLTFTLEWFLTVNRGIILQVIYTEAPPNDRRNYYDSIQRWLSDRRTDGRTDRRSGSWWWWSSFLSWKETMAAGCSFSPMYSFWVSTEINMSSLPCSLPPRYIFALVAFGAESFSQIDDKCI